jgi:3-hydroxyisobutyrate dehydrogenase-like beta-hydroxyacid dehydrogenase
MNLITGLAQELGIDLVATPAVKNAYAAAVEQGLSDRDMSALIDCFKKA